jgi:hypothetical protein
VEKRESMSNTAVSSNATSGSKLSRVARTGDPLTRGISEIYSPNEFSVHRVATIGRDRERATLTAHQTLRTMSRLAATLG